jgi:hypothetical protein
MKYFFDTEFIESGPENPLQLLSIGIVSENGKEYYAVVDPIDVNLNLADDWLQNNVINHLDFINSSKRKKIIAKEIVNFVGKDPVFWGWYSDYDWVILCQLYGKMTSLPESWPMFCLDLKQETYRLGNPKLPKLPGKIEHHALWDARELKFRYEWLVGLSHD